MGSSYELVSSTVAGSNTTMSASKPAEQQALAAQPGLGRRQRRELAHGILERNHRILPHVPTQDSGAGGIGAGVRFATAEQPVGDDVGQGVAQNGANVRLHPTRRRSCRRPVAPPPAGRRPHPRAPHRVAPRSGPGSCPRTSGWRRCSPMRRRCSPSRGCRRSSPNPCARRCRA